MDYSFANSINLPHTVCLFTGKKRKRSTKFFIVHLHGLDYLAMMQYSPQLPNLYSAIATCVARVHTVSSWEHMFSIIAHCF